MVRVPRTVPQPWGGQQGTIRFRSPARPGSGPGDDRVAEAADAGEWDLTPDWLAGGESAPLEWFSDGGAADEIIRDLIAAAARHPRTRWCLTVLNPDGTAAAHGCAPGRHPAPPA